MVTSANIITKSGGKKRNRIDTQALLLAINANITRKSGEKRQEKDRHVVDCC